MMWKKRLVAASIAVLMCMSGCSNTNSESPSSAGKPLEEGIQPTTVQATTPDGSEPSASAAEGTTSAGTEQTEPVQTGTSQTDPTATEPAQTTPTQTEPAATEPAPTETIAAQQVISRAVSILASSRPDVKYDPAWGSGTAVELLVEPKQTEAAMADKLVAYLRELFSDGDATYTYSLGYLHYDTERNNHVFVVTYSSGEQISGGASFDSASVVAQATQIVLSSGSVTTFGGSDYEVCLTIRDVPSFYGTQEAAQCLADAVKREISTKNLLGADYTEFCITYYAEEDTCYVFLLFLK